MKKKLTNTEIKAIAKKLMNSFSKTIQVPDDEDSKIELRTKSGIDKDALYYLISYIDYGDFWINFKVVFYRTHLRYDVELNDADLFCKIIEYSREDEIKYSIKFINEKIDILLNIINQCGEFDLDSKKTTAQVKLNTLINE